MEKKITKNKLINTFLNFPDWNIGKKIMNNKTDMMKALDSGKTIWQISIIPRTGEPDNMIMYMYYYHKYKSADSDNDHITVSRLIAGDDAMVRTVFPDGTKSSGCWCKTINLDDMWNDEDIFYYECGQKC